MAGTIPALSLSTQFDKNGNLLAGGKVYFYQANTLTPQNVFKDTGLTLPHPNPITLDASARVPEFYCADGSIRCRVTDAAGVVQIDALNLLVVGASGGGGGGSSVDPATIFQTGDVIWLDVSGTRSGWVRDNGRTIGSATSGASERANADCQPLFEYLWNTYDNTRCPVVGGRGATALDDWNANKQITMPDKRGYIPGGLDDMGNVAANRFASVPVVLGSTTTAGSVLGETTHVLSKSEAPTGLFTLNDPGHTHATTAIAQSGSSGPVGGVIGGPASISPAMTGITLTDHAGDTAHNNVQKTVLGTFYRKL